MFSQSESLWCLCSLSILLLFDCHSVQSIYVNPEVATGPRKQSVWTRARENIGKDFQGAAESFEAVRCRACFAFAWQVKIPLSYFQRSLPSFSVPRRREARYGMTMGYSVLPSWPTEWEHGYAKCGKGGVFILLAKFGGSSKRLHRNINMLLKKLEYAILIG